MPAQTFVTACSARYSLCVKQNGIALQHAWVLSCTSTFNDSPKSPRLRAQRPPASTGCTDLRRNYDWHAPASRPRTLHASTAALRVCETACSARFFNMREAKLVSLCLVLGYRVAQAHLTIRRSRSGCGRSGLLPVLACTDLRRHNDCHAPASCPLFDCQSHFATCQRVKHQLCNQRPTRSPGTTLPNDKSKENY